MFHEKPWTEEQRQWLWKVETALAAGLLFAQMHSGKYWECRRNGRTKTWKTRPGEFKIPVKAGFRSCGYITHNSSVGKWQDFEIREAS